MAAEERLTLEEKEQNLSNAKRADESDIEPAFIVAEIIARADSKIERFKSSILPRIPRNLNFKPNAAQILLSILRSNDDLLDEDTLIGILQSDVLTLYHLGDENEATVPNARIYPTERSKMLSGDKRQEVVQAMKEIVIMCAAPPCKKKGGSKRKRSKKKKSRRKQSKKRR